MLDEPVYELDMLQFIPPLPQYLTVLSREYSTPQKMLYEMVVELIANESTDYAVIVRALGWLDPELPMLKILEEALIKCCPHNVRIAVWL
jgi:hypothetical protein